MARTLAVLLRARRERLIWAAGHGGRSCVATCAVRSAALKVARSSKSRAAHCAGLPIATRGHLKNRPLAPLAMRCFKRERRVSHEAWERRGSSVRRIRFRDPSTCGRRPQPVSADGGRPARSARKARDHRSRAPQRPAAAARSDRRRPATWLLPGRSPGSGHDGDP
jgi:hypothetical protein